MSAHRPGVVLIIALLVLVALGGIASSLLFIGTQEAMIARSGEDALRARVAAESAVRTAIAGWATRRYRDMAVAETRAADEPFDGAAATVVRLAGRLYLVRADAATAGMARASAAALVRAIGVDEPWRAFPAAITTRGTVAVEADAAVLVTPRESPPGWSAADCPFEAWTVERDALGDRFPAPVLRVGAGAVPAGDGDGGAADVDGPEGAPAPIDFSRVGPLGREQLRDLADRIASGDVSPAPTARGTVCDTAAPAGWGDPLSPAGACRDHFPVIYAPGDLHVSGGAGQGLLVVDGDLVLSGDARFYGAVHVAGTVTVRDRAAVYGAVTAADTGRSRIEDGGVVAYSACTLWRTFSAAPALNRPFAPAGRGWIAVHGPDVRETKKVAG